MIDEFNGIERRLNELSERLERLEALKNRPRTDFDQDPYLRDIVERNFEVAIQCCLDICHRIISLQKARKPADYYEAILMMGELGIVPPDLARQLAPLSGFRNILAHEYLAINWNIVYQHLQQIDDLTQFGDHVSLWFSGSVNTPPTK